MEPPLHMQSIVDWTVIMQRIPVFPIFWRIAVPYPHGVVFHKEWPCGKIGCMMPVSVIRVEKWKS